MLAALPFDAQAVTTIAPLLSIVLTVGRAGAKAVLIPSGSGLPGAGMEAPPRSGPALLAGPNRSGASAVIASYGVGTV